MHRLIMSRSRAVFFVWVWNFGYDSGWVFEASGWHMSQEIPIVPPRALALWKFL